MPVRIVFETHSTTEDNEAAGLPARCPAGCPQSAGNRQPSLGAGEQVTA